MPLRPIRILLVGDDSDLAIAVVAALDADERSGCIGVLPIKTTRFEQFLSLADSRKLTVESVGEGASGDIVALLDRYDVVAFLPIAAALDSHHDGGPDHQGLEVKGTLMRDVASHCSGKPSLVVGFEGVPEHKDHSGSTLGKLRGLLSKSGAVVCSITAGVPSNLLLSIALFQAIPKRRFMLPLDDARFAPITTYDLARAVTFLLLSLIPSGALESSPLCLPEEHRGQFYVLTGPEEVDSGELAELVSTFTREVPKSFDLGYISCSHNELKRILDDLSDFFAMGLSLPTTGEHDRKLGLGPWILREGEAETFLAVLEDVKRGYEGHEEALRTGAKILFDPLEHAATTTTQDLQVLVGGPGMSLTELFTRHREILLKAAEDSAASPRSSLSRRSRSNSLVTVAEAISDVGAKE